jgi:AraC-like DNA-binding protein
MPTMTYFSNILPTLHQTLQDKSWPWVDVAKGYLDGGKDMSAFTSDHKVTFGHWVGTLADSYKFYSQVTSIDFFKRYPAFVRVVTVSTIALCALNSLHYFSNAFKRVWNFTPRVYAVVNLATTVREFYERPMKAATYFASAIFHLAAQSQKDELFSSSLAATGWIARSNVFWNGGWQERSLIVFKAGKDLFKGFRWDARRG